MTHGQTKQCMARVASRPTMPSAQGVFTALVLCLAPAVNADVLPLQDEEAALRTLQATAAMHATWDALLSSMQAGDRKAASMLIHPNRRVEFLATTPADLTRVLRPKPDPGQPWRCDVVDAIAQCTFRFINERGQAEEMEIPFVQAHGVWYLTF